MQMFKVPGEVPEVGAIASQSETFPNASVVLARR